MRCSRGPLPRGRAVTFVLVLAAVAMSSNAPASARVTATTVDQSFACSVKLGGQHAYFNLQAGAKDPPANVAYWSLYLAKKKRGAAGAQSVAQMSFGSASKGLRVDAALCKHSSARVPLHSSRLGAGQTVTSNYQGYFSSRCQSSSRALVRIRLQERSGIPVRAQIAIVNANARKSPIADIAWSPTRITYFLGNGCT